MGPGMGPGMMGGGWGNYNPNSNVKPITIDVIALLARQGAKNFAVHEHDCLFSVCLADIAAGIVGTLRLAGVPLVFHQLLIVRIIHERHLALTQGDLSHRSFSKRNNARSVLKHARAMTFQTLRLLDTTGVKFQRLGH